MQNINIVGEWYMFFKKYKNNIIYVVSFTLFLTVIFKIYWYYQERTHYIPKITNSVSITELFEKDGQQLPNQYNLQLDENHNLNYILKLTIEDKNAESAVLTAGIDYNQISLFADKDGKANDMEYKINLSSDKTEVNVPINSNLNKLSSGVHILNFTLNLIDKKTTLKNSKTNVSYSTRYNLIVDKSNSISIENSPSIINNSIKSNNKIGIFLNEISKNNVINAKPGENIEIPILAGGFKNTSYNYCDYMFWISLNSVQYIFNNNEKNYYFRLKNEELLRQNIDIQAPKEKGTYEIYGYLAINPFLKLEEGNNQNTSIETSNKIILQVQ